MFYLKVTYETFYINQNWIDQCNATLYFEHKNGNGIFLLLYSLSKMFMH